MFNVQWYIKNDLLCKVLTLNDLMPTIQPIRLSCSQNITKQSFHASHCHICINHPKGKFMIIIRTFNRMHFKRVLIANNFICEQWIYKVYVFKERQFKFLHFKYSPSCQMAWVNYSQHLSLFFCLTVILSQLAIGFSLFFLGGGGYGIEVSIILSQFFL